MTHREVQGITLAEKHKDTVRLSEDGEQTTVFNKINWIVETYPAHNSLKYTFHAPNGGWRGKGEAARFKAMGVSRGFPDIANPIIKFAIEMKVGYNKATQEQFDWLIALQSAGWKVGIAYSARDAYDFLMEWLNIPAEYFE